MSNNHLFIEIIIRIFLGIIFLILDFSEPFQRQIQPEELWLYKNPRTHSYVPSAMLWLIAFLIPSIVIFMVNMTRKQKTDGEEALLGVSLALMINGIVTNIIKLIVGRPRPDYFWRCFPDGQIKPNLECTGKREEIIEGLKSFPSGHSSFSFVSMGYVSLYLLGKLHVFTAKGRGQSWRLIIAIIPLLFALIVALSRMCDYHHHWQDVCFGSLLGFFFAWLCYRQYYPALNHPSCAMPYSFASVQKNNGNNIEKMDENLEEIKWI